MEKLTIAVLDYATGSVDIYRNVDESIGAEKFLTEKYYRIDDLQWMVMTEGTMHIEIHEDQ